MPTDKPRYSITVTEDMLSQIDEHWHENKFTTRTQATIDLIKKGMLEHLSIANDKSLYSQAEQTLMKKYRALDEQNRQAVDLTIDAMLTAQDAKKGTAGAKNDVKGVRVG